MWLIAQMKAYSTLMKNWALIFGVKLSEMKNVVHLRVELAGAGLFEAPSLILSH